MIKTLRNNKLLLRSRKGFLKGRLSFSEIKGFYRKSTKPIPAKDVEQKLLNETRAKIIQHQRKVAFQRIVIATLLLIVLLVPIYFFFTYRFTEAPTSSVLINVENLYNPYSKENTANEMIRIGLKNKYKGNYFLATGNFENALKKYQDNMPNK